MKAEAIGCIKIKKVCFRSVTITDLIREVLLLLEVAVNVPYELSRSQRDAP